jgi:uncharacterized membrane protein
MNKYNTFLFVFIVSVIAMVVFFAFYLQAIFGFAMNINEFDRNQIAPFEFLRQIFTPQVIISAAVMAFSGLACRVLGIVHVAKSKTVTDGEKALWIVGFIIMGFITSIVFLVMAKGRKFVA